MATSVTHLVRAPCAPNWVRTTWVSGGADSRAGRLTIQGDMEYAKGTRGPPDASGVAASRCHTLRTEEGLHEHEVGGSWPWGGLDQTCDALCGCDSGSGCV
jgi:hypothetical protein